LAVLGYLGLVLVIPVLRLRRRRRLADPALRVAAAWRETLVVLRGAGLTTVDALTTGEIAALAARRLDLSAPASLAPLARLTDAAAFSGSHTDPVYADVAWCHRDRVAALVRRRVGRVRAVLRRLGPRTLRD
jgi:hypothetical protein